MICKKLSEFFIIISMSSSSSSSSYDSSSRSLASLLRAANEAVSKQEAKETIKSYELKFVKKFEAIVEYEDFYRLPMSNIFSIIKKVDFSTIYDYPSVIQKIIKNITKQHPQQSGLLMNCINIDNCLFSYNDFFQIIKCFKSCSICMQLVKLYNESQVMIERDYEYELKMKEQEMESLKQNFKQNTKELKEQIKKQTSINPNNKQLFPEVVEKPTKFIPNIYEATRKGDLLSVQYLIEKMGVNKNEQEARLFGPSCSPMHIACEYGYIHIVRYLIEQQHAEINPRNSAGMTPLYVAALNNQTNIVKYLCEKKATIDAKSKLEDTPLIVATKNKHEQNVQTLCDYGADVNFIDKDGDAPLHIAAKNSDSLIITCLLDHNADVNIKNSKEETPLHVACHYSNLNIVKKLCEYGADVNAVSKSGNKPIHTASLYNHYKIVKYFIEEKHIDKEQENDYGSTPLQVAVRANCFETVQFLIKDMKCNINSCDNVGNTSLHKAVNEGNINLIEYLLKNGANKKLKNKNGKIPIELADKRAVKKLLQ